MLSASSTSFARVPRRAILFVAFGLILLGGLGAYYYYALRSRGPNVSALRKDLLEQFDVKFPGRGGTDYPGNTVEDVPKAYAMILKAELLPAVTGAGGISARARNAGKFLLEHSDERKDGFPGWGVPVAWDPYGDGSTNPAHTKYTISTAIVIDALLDWLDADQTIAREPVLSLIREAIMPYLDPAVLSPSGLLPYSLEPVDRPYDTFNPAAYLAGVMQRYSRRETDPELARRIQAVADKTVAAHLANRQMTANGAWYWHYSITEPVPNDLAHAGYVMLGLQLYAQYGGALRDQLDVAAIQKHLADFPDPTSGKLMAWPHFRTDANTPARSYDLGMGLYLVCTSSLSQLRALYLDALPSYRTATGAYLRFPPGTRKPEIVVREYEGYILLGLAACLPPAAR